MTLIAPSILSADLTHLQEEMDSVASADWVQVDVMDGKFVSNTSFRPSVMKDIKTNLVIDVHLMVINPFAYIDECIDAHAKNITFHAEAVPQTVDRKTLIALIRSKGAQAGIAVNPETHIQAIDDVIEDIDLVLIMSVHPGAGGQAFIPEVLEKVKAVKQRIPTRLVQIDGGVNAETAKRCREAGVDCLVAGSYIFSSQERTQAIQSLRS
jgi:ribulose-phosphate 3-epimerase